MPRPNGCSRSGAADLGQRQQVVDHHAQASPIAAPSAPYRGISSTSRPTVTASATSTLTRFHEVRPAIASTMSTMPQPVATSIAPASTTTTGAPAR